ncbi:hypothetical protein AK830_g7575 [Neonectria ditissima]|uniref:SCP domain-containing protein n=1 Tax=Neonectria ditissima TaxID=78410 RepID=A0A0P7AMC6_9HYPO|nr:hypothetical protein AK830_g7575 [Neonectria ditissima]
MYFFRMLGFLAMSLAALVVSADDRQLALDKINLARQAKGVPSLTWNPDLAAYAQFWANQMGSDAQPFAHAPLQYRPHQGETIYEHQSGHCDAAFDGPLQTAVHDWLLEGSIYDGQPIRTGQEPWLHWSQCMWSGTTQIGCARAYSISGPYKVYSVCRFLPEGNVIGQKPF